jgi:hypothetical protein
MIPHRCIVVRIISCTREVISSKEGEISENFEHELVDQHQQMVVT